MPGASAAIARNETLVHDKALVPKTPSDLTPARGERAATAARLFEARGRADRRDGDVSAAVGAAVEGEPALGPGRPLDPAVGGAIGRRLGHDFSRVRVHTDVRAAESARRENALAYAVGDDVVFGAGRYDPRTPRGRALLVHELAHVAHEGAGVVGRAVSGDYARIEDTLTYGLFDWAITDADAHEVLTILAGLGAPDLVDTVVAMERDGFVARLLENVSDRDRVDFAPLIQSIHRQRSASRTAAHIESLLSYGVLDWVVTDAEAHVALEALQSLRPTPDRLKTVVVAIPALQYERFYDNLSAADRRDNLPFVEELEIIRQTGMTFAELSLAQKTHLEARAAAAGISVGAFLRGDAASRAYGGHPATWWPSLTPAEKAAWVTRFDAAVTAVKAAAPKEIGDLITAAEAAGGGIRWEPEAVETLGPNIAAFRRGHVLGVGKRWLEAAEANPANIFENIAHELGGHRDYGDTASWQIMRGTLAALPAGERALAESGPRTFSTAYSYMETEIYAELRELPYRAAGSVGDEPTRDVEDKLQDLKAAFAPAIAEAVVRGFRRRIALDSRITEDARRLFDEKVQVVFGVTF